MPDSPPVGRYALLIAVGEYEDPALRRLRAPQQDVHSLAAVLEDPAVGNFTVRTMQDPADHEVRREIEDLLADRVNDDLVLIYFSCHGIVDPLHRLYFAASNTVLTRPASTAISRSFVNEQLAACRAAAKVLVLDCCFAGAFAEGFKSVPLGALDGQIGRGYVVISACDSYEYAFESDGLVEAAPRGSIFTDVLLEGLATGGADLDGDGRIGVDELFRYVHDGVVRRRPDQKPKWSAHNAEPHIYLAEVARQPPGAAILAVTGAAGVTAAGAVLTGVAGGIAAAGAAGGVTAAAGAAGGVTAVTGSGRTDPPLRPCNYNRHQAMVACGFRTGADLVRRTFGPVGRRVLVEDEQGVYHELGDAASIVRLLAPRDTRDTIGVSYVKELVEAVRHRVGDGATTTVVLARAMIDGASAALRAGANPVALRRGVEAATLDVIAELAVIAVALETKEQLRAVSTIASGDATIGDLLAEAMEKVGREGVITVEESNLFGLELELTEGMSLPAGHVSPYFVTDPHGAEAVLDEPYILLVDQRLAGVDELLPILDLVMEEGRPLAVFAQDIRDAALAVLVVNKVREAFLSVAVRMPWPDEERRTLLEDLGVLTGGTVVRAGVGGGLPSATVAMLGRARRVITTRDGSTVVDGRGDIDAIHRRVRQIRMEIEREDPGQDRRLLRERLARLAGGVAVLRVGEVSDAHLRARRRQIDDAVRSAKAAVEWGLVPGGGAALLTVADRLTGRRPIGLDEASGYAVVVDALAAPFEELMRNAGRSPAARAELISRGPAVTFDVVAGRYVVALDAGIVDAAAVLREAVVAASGALARYLMVA